MNEIIKQNGIKFGIFLGIAGILAQVTTYILGSNEAVASFVGVIFWIVYLLIRIFQLITTKKQLNGIISFKESFTTLLICVTNGILISQLFTYLFMNHIDPVYGAELNKFMNEKAIQASYEASKLMGVKINSVELKAIANNDNFSPLKILQGTAVAILISSVMNLILAAIFKSKTNNSPFNQ